MSIVQGLSINAVMAAMGLAYSHGRGAGCEARERMMQAIVARDDAAYELWSEASLVLNGLSRSGADASPVPVRARSDGHLPD